MKLKGGAVIVAGFVGMVGEVISQYSKDIVDGFLTKKGLPTEIELGKKAENSEEEETE